ncbi:ComGF family competence protein [Radiobacillus kanasensis]|uniref:competence type IV pilus minor pilin ComGF n=1 Tax=Radiobacillus kanasensis TaxID=2844358 RepID=UPI001E35F6B8|nr:competence type IV pilus minor pilin ComGF [Radiobacillus kanasensis]UFT97770.1 ComGF family competence protein [Radiobacillus kanasensis]
MRMNKPRIFACMGSEHGQKGFTLISCLLSLTILLTTLPFLPFMFKSLSYNTYYNELSIQQFFLFLADECHQANSIVIDENRITLTQDNGKNVELSLYDKVIRRQVSGQGHEILVRQIQTFVATKVPGGLKIQIRAMEGKSYEKIISTS